MDAPVEMTGDGDGSRGGLCIPPPVGMTDDGRECRRYTDVRRGLPYERAAVLEAKTLPLRRHRRACAGGGHFGWRCVETMGDEEGRETTPQETHARVLRTSGWIESVRVSALGIAASVMLARFAAAPLGHECEVR